MIKRVKATNWLDVCWEECEAMAKWVAENYNRTRSVNKLKDCWLDANSYNRGTVRANCLFCHYVCLSSHSCDHCPGKLVDAQFTCTNPLYHYSKRPVKFYEKIREMNEERKDVPTADLLKNEITH